MVILEPISQKDFDQLLENEIRNYAAGHVQAGNWPEEGSLERSRKEFEAVLPDGLQTKDQYIWSVVDQNDKIGMLWVQIRNNKAFINDFLVHEEFRGKGYGKQALAAMDDWLKALDVDSVSLHVFGDNLPAQELYKKMGYEITDMHMQKKYR